MNCLDSFEPYDSMHRVQSERNLVFEPAYHAFKGLGSEESMLFRVVVLNLSFTETNGNGCPQQRRLVSLWNRKPRVSKLKDLICLYKTQFYARRFV